MTKEKIKNGGVDWKMWISGWAPHRTDHGRILAEQSFPMKHCSILWKIREEKRNWTWWRSLIGRIHLYSIIVLFFLLFLTRKKENLNVEKIHFFFSYCFWKECVDRITCASYCFLGLKGLLRSCCRYFLSSEGLHKMKGVRYRLVLLQGPAISYFFFSRWDRSIRWKPTVPPTLATL
jgi:hypothetical protein